MEGFASALEGIVRLIAVYVAAFTEGATALIVIFAVLEALFGAARALIGLDREVRKETIRLRLGRWLSVVLEFLLAADILRTAIAPSWDDIGKWQPSPGFARRSITFCNARCARLEGQMQWWAIQVRRLDKLVKLQLP